MATATKQTGFRFPADAVKKLDHLAKAFSKQTGFKWNRTTVLLHLIRKEKLK